MPGGREEAGEAGVGGVRPVLSGDAAHEVLGVRGIMLLLLLRRGGSIGITPHVPRAHDLTDRFEPVCPLLVITLLCSSLDTPDNAPTPHPQPFRLTGARHCYVLPLMPAACRSTQPPRTTHRSLLGARGGIGGSVRSSGGPSTLTARSTSSVEAICSKRS